MMKSKHTVLMKIRDGVACDGTPGDELLKKVNAENFWPLTAFGISNLTGTGCRFKVKGDLFKGDVAISAMDSSNFCVMLGSVRKKKFKIKHCFSDVPGEKLTAVLSAALDDNLATIT